MLIQAQNIFMNYSLLEKTAILIIVMLSVFAWFDKYLNINYGKFQNSLLKLKLSSNLAWFLFEIPNLIYPIYIFSSQECLLSCNCFHILPFIIHYVNRAIIYPLKIEANSQPFPIEIFLMTLLYTNSNAYVQTKFISTQHQLYNANFYVGYVIFFIGMYINVSSDNILKDMKKQITKRNIEKGENVRYQVPKKGLFRYVSQANYFGEVIEWFGFSILNNFSFNSLLFAFSTLSILVSRALRTHKWYQKTFPDYPPYKKAIIPFVI